MVHHGPNEGRGSVPGLCVDCALGMNAYWALCLAMRLGDARLQAVHGLWIMYAYGL